MKAEKKSAGAAKAGDKKHTKDSEKAAPAAAAVARDPHAQTRAACLAIPEHKLRPINVDVPAACSVMLGASEAINEKLDEIVTVIPGFERAWATELTERAEFAHYTYSACAGVADDKTARDELAKGTALRKRMQDWADSCLKLGFASGLDLRSIERIAYGYTDTPLALNALHAFFIEQREHIEPNVKLPWGDIESARTIAARISTLSRSTGKTDASAANWDLAQRAFTLVADAYDECRAALTYVRRHHDDAHEIAPGYVNRATGKTARKESADDDDASDGPADEKNKSDDSADKPRALREERSDEKE